MQRRCVKSLLHIIGLFNFELYPRIEVFTVLEAVKGVEARQWMQEREEDHQRHEAANSLAIKIINSRKTRIAYF
jgi:hypothetical protein